MNGTDEVQTIAISSGPVLPQVQTLRTSTIDRDEVQFVRATGNNVDEVQEIVTSATRVPEVQVIRVASDDVNEIHALELRDRNGTAASELTLVVVSTDVGNGPTGLDDREFAINCGGSPSDQVVYEWDSDGSVQNS